MSTFLELVDLALGDDFEPTKYRGRAQRAVNEALGRIHRRVRLPSAEETEDVALVAGTMDYSLPSSSVRVASVHLRDPWTPLEHVDWDQLDPDSTGTGVPGQFAIRGSTLRVSPTPAAAVTARVRFRGAATVLEGDSDESGLAEEYEDLVVTWARSRLYRWEEDLEMARALRDEFEADLLLMRADVQRAVENRGRRVPGMWQGESSRPSFVRPSS